VVGVLSALVVTLVSTFFPPSAFSELMFKLQLSSWIILAEATSISYLSVSHRIVCLSFRERISAVN
jgi:hypothetical protein